MHFSQGGYAKVAAETIGSSFTRAVTAATHRASQGTMIATASTRDLNIASTRIVIRPLSEPRQRLDVTEVVQQAIASHLGRLYGGNEVLNNLEAERLLQDALLGMNRRERWPL
jgi:hypothetical protein